MEPISFDVTPLVRQLKLKDDAEISVPTTAVSKVGSFPNYLPKKGSWGAALAQEQLHALATHLLARAAHDGLHTVGITSSMAGEGKTTVSLGLAERLAGSGKRVLLIDLDTHRASLTRSLGLGRVPGVREARENGTSASRPAATDLPGVEVLPAGGVPGVNGFPVLEKGFLNRLLEPLRGEYDFVLMDCPPMVPVAETFVVREVVDGVIFVVRANVTPREVVQQALRDFGTEKLFAAVLNRARPHNIPYFREVYGYYRRD